MSTCEQSKFYCVFTLSLPIRCITLSSGEPKKTEFVSTKQKMKDSLITEDVQYLIQLINYSVRSRLSVYT